MRIEERCNGTPAEFGAAFAVIAKEIRANYESEDRLSFIVEIGIDENGKMRQGLQFPAEINPLIAWFAKPNLPESGRCSIAAYKTPGKKTMIKISAEDEDWPELDELWTLIKNELESQGWVFEEKTEDEYPYPFPTNVNRRNEWKMAYKQVMRVRIEKREDWDYGQVPSPNPSTDEYRDACELAIGWKPDPKVMRAIEHYGDEGRLK